VQDLHYLHMYGRALSLLATKADTADQASFFATAAQSILQGETQLHKQLMAAWGVSTADAEASPMQPTCSMYTSYILATVATRPFFEGVSLITPVHVTGHGRGHTRALYADGRRLLTACK
jgi:thiaminase (transcriptional activator TenA)